MRLRELRADWRGHTAELLAKAAASDALDVPLSPADRERLVEWLRREGALTPDLRYAGTPRRGYAIAPGAGDAAGTVAGPASLDALLGAGFAAYLTTEVVLQTPMFQVVGGMDRLAAALAQRVQRVTLGARVTAIDQPGRRVRVRCEQNGQPREIEADYAVCALPLTELRELALDVSPAMKQAIGAISYSAAGKIGVQFKRRFWEEDEGIYGGISRTSLDITQILYPSTGYLSPKGVVVGYYQNGEKARAMGALPHARLLEQAVAQGEQVHPQYRAELESSFSIAWEHVRFNRGGWAQFTEAQRQAEYVTLQQADGAVYLAGDHLSYLSGWMAGALGSGRAVARRIHERASRELPSAVTAMARR
jgi:monoamine oxidase